MFTVDICLRFFITYEDIHCRQVKTIKEIAYNYIKTELIFDLITVLPLMRMIKPHNLFSENAHSEHVTPSSLLKGNNTNNDASKEFRDIEINLIYLIKFLRIKKAYYLLNTSKFKKMVF